MPLRVTLGIRRISVGTNCLCCSCCVVACIAGDTHIACVARVVLLVLNCFPNAVLTLTTHAH